MSELKGQLLGMLLVLAVFGIVAGVLVTGFQNSARKLADKMSGEESVLVVAASKSS